MVFDYINPSIIRYRSGLLYPIHNRIQRLEETGQLNILDDRRRLDINVYYQLQQLIEQNQLSAVILPLIQKTKEIHPNLLNVFHVSGIAGYTLFYKPGTFTGSILCTLF